MNERIQKLAEQSTSIVEMVGPQGYTSSYAKFDKEKFAELIVKECLGIVADADMSGSWITHPKDVLYVACDQVKKHFGVEE
jgi:hypothetical protein